MAFYKVSESFAIDWAKDMIMTEGCCALCLFVSHREHWRLLCYFAQTAFGQSWHLNQAVYIDEAAPWHILSLFSIEIDSFIESSLLLGLFSVAYWSAGEWTHNKQLTAFRLDVGGCQFWQLYTCAMLCCKIAWESVVSKLHSSTCISHLCVWFLLVNLFIRYNSMQ